MGAGLGALGGAAVAPKGHRLSGAITGGAAGALTGGIGKGLIRKATGKGTLLGTMRRTSLDEAAKGALVNTAASALANKLTKGKSTAVRTAAPFVDDAVVAGMMLAKA